MANPLQFSFIAITRIRPITRQPETSPDICKSPTAIGESVETANYGSLLARVDDSLGTIKA